MSQLIKQRLENSLEGAAASGRKIATYMLANLHELPFQTSASIAAKLGVSESSVGRYCRSWVMPTSRRLSKTCRTIWAMARGW